MNLQNRLSIINKILVIFNVVFILLYIFTRFGEIDFSMNINYFREDPNMYGAGDLQLTLFDFKNKIFVLVISCLELVALWCTRLNNYIFAGVMCVLKSFFPILISVLGIIDMCCKEENINITFFGYLIAAIGVVSIGLYVYRSDLKAKPSLYRCYDMDEQIPSDYPQTEKDGKNW